jgi:hypothetical protein
MGVDIYLNSIFEPWAKMHPPERSNRRLSAEEVIQALEERFEQARSSGGYYRNAYNDTDVMWAMGMAWSEDVGKKLDSKRRLPVAAARELIDKIEARPLTRERVARHIFEHMSDGFVDHPITGDMKRRDAHINGPLEPPDLDAQGAYLNTRRDQLLAILRKSVELGEPLKCSL